ncbi:MAG: RND family transporter [Chitinispirillaceae bacterium]|nr:RND family transporter [Chitinispirillaceae bacterium]
MAKELFVIRYRWPIIIACLLLAGAMGSQLRNLEINADFLFMFSPEMPSRINTEKIEKIFGPNDMLFILFDAQDVLSDATLRRVKTISRELKKTDGIKTVLSIFDTKNIKGEDGAMIVESAVKAIPKTASERETLRKSLSGNELASEVVVSKDFKVTAILLTLNPDAPKQDVYQRVRKIVNGFPGNEKVLIGGIPAFQTVIIDNIAHDMLILIPGALLIILAILYAFFRQLRGIVLPLCVVLLSTIFGMGILPLMGWKMTLLSALLPIMVVAFSNNYGIYLIARYLDLCGGSNHLSKKQIATEVFRGLYQPILFSGITTMVGLLGMLSHAVIPAKQIGLAAAIAVGFSLAVSLGGIPAVLSLLKLPKQHPKKAGKKSLQFLDTGLRKTSEIVVRHPKTTLLVTAIIALIGIGFAACVNVDANQENLFGRNHPIIRCTRLINKHFGGSQNISILFKGDIKDPELLTKLETYKDSLEHLPGVGQVTSIADVIRIISKALNDTGEAGYNKIPRTRDAVAQYLELYSMSGNPDDFERLVDFNYEKAQFVVRINNGATPVINAVVRKIESISRKDRNLVTFGGWAVMYADLAAAILKGQIISIVSALFAIAILVMLMFRSATAGFLSLVPLTFAIIIGFGTMGAFGVNLDMATALITSVVIGTGVDFMLQFLWRYRSIRQNGVPYDNAVKETLSTVGRTIVFNALCVASGLGVLIFSSMPPLRYFAILFGVLTLACMCGTLVVIPALCLVWKPKFLEPIKADDEDQNFPKEVVHA